MTATSDKPQDLVILGGGLVGMTLALAAAKKGLSTHVIAPAMQCQATGSSYERVVATCRLPNGRDLGAAMLATGTVVPWR